MKTLQSVGMGVLLAWLMVAGTRGQGLPDWNDGERARPEAEDRVAGEMLLTEKSEPGESGETSEATLDLDRPTAAEITGTEPMLTEISEKFWPDYFSGHPQSFLVDPQGLLGPVNYRERLAFLNYHAGDSLIDLFVYVFGGDQEIPGEVREEELVERLFSEGRPAAVIYYFIGVPQRSVMYLSPSLTDTVSVAEQRRALESSVMQALDEVDPAGQLQAFLVQMSIRIYWIERMLGGAESEGASMPAPVPVTKAREGKSRLMQLLEPHVATARRLAVPAAVVLGLLLAAFAVSFRVNWRARHRLPEFDVEPRLGGAHAAGVGAVISFASAALPPASQRDQVPDYLRRV